MTSSYHIEIYSAGEWFPYYLNGQPMFDTFQKINGRLYSMEAISLVDSVNFIRDLRQRNPGREFRIRQNEAKAVQRLSGLIMHRITEIHA